MHCMHIFTGRYAKQGLKVDDVNRYIMLTSNKQHGLVPFHGVWWDLWDTLVVCGQTCWYAVVSVSLWLEKSCRSLPFFFFFFFLLIWLQLHLISISCCFDCLHACMQSWFSSHNFIASIKSSSLQSIGFFGPGIALIGLTTARNPFLASAWLTIAVGLKSFSHSGFLVNLQVGVPELQWLKCLSLISEVLSNFLFILSISRRSLQVILVFYMVPLNLLYNELVLIYLFKIVLDNFKILI